MHIAASSSVILSIPEEVLSSNGTNIDEMNQKNDDFIGEIFGNIIIICINIENNFCKAPKLYEPPLVFNVGCDIIRNIIGEVRLRLCDANRRGNNYRK